jgi:TonB family protein
MRTKRYLATASMVALSACANPTSPGSIRPGSPINTADSVAFPSAEYDAPPRLLSGNAPTYPISRLLKGVGGQATIAFTILEDGTTADFVVISTDYEYYASHAVLAVKEWRYKPAIKDGHPVAIRVVQSFKFATS